MLDRRRLLGALVDRQHQTAVHQLFVDVDGRAGQDQHHRAFHPVLAGDQLPRRRVLAGRGDRQRALALQQLQRIRRLPHAFFLGDGEDLVLEVAFADVEQALPGHRAVVHALAFRHQRQQRVHERALAGRTRGLDQDRERLFQQPRGHRQIPHQRIGAFADHADGFHVGRDALDKIQIAQQGEARGFLGGSECRRLVRSVWLQRPTDRGFLQRLQRDHQRGQVAGDDRLGDAQLQRRRFDERSALPRLIQVQRVQVQVLAGTQAQCHLQHLGREVAGQAAHAIAARAATEPDVVPAGNRQPVRWRRQRRQGCRRRINDLRHFRVSGQKPVKQNNSPR